MKRQTLTSELAAAGLMIALGAALWLVLSVQAVNPPGGPLAQDVAGTAMVAFTAAPVTATWPPFEAQHQPGVADLLASPPAAGERVEVDAYYGGALAGPMFGHGPPPPGDQVVCPNPWPATLTDRPFPTTLQYLNTTTGNLLPSNAAWLVAVASEQTRPGSHVAYPTLPYHARLRGYLGEPAFAGCVSAERLFVVEQVVQIYEQEPPTDLAPGLRVPADYGKWPRYQDAALGYSLPYPPGWQAETADEWTLRLIGPLWPEHAVSVHVYDGETHYDQYESDPAKISPLLQGVGWGVFEQGWSSLAPAADESPGLAGYFVERETGQPDARSVAVLFSGGGRTYELALTFPTGFAASQELLTGYTGIVDGFRLDVDPGLTPTAPVRQDLGAGPFLTEAQALAAAEERAGNALELLAAELVSEAEARRQAEACNTFMGHPDGVWLLNIRGPFEGQTRNMHLFLDAANGEQLCGEEIVPTEGPSTEITVPPGAPTLAPTATPHVPGTAVSLPPDVYPSPVATLQAIGLEDRGCPNPVGVEADAVLDAEAALAVMRAYFSADPMLAQQGRDPVLWPAGDFATTPLPDEEQQPGWFQPPRPAVDSPYAGALRAHCGTETLAASWTVVYCRVECDAPRLSASLMEDYFLLRRAGRWLVWYVWP